MRIILHKLPYYSVMLVLLCCLKAPLAQSPAATPPDSKPISQVQQSVSTIKTTTRVVLLDVVATDKNKHPVTDLKKEDFTILERGQKNALASFRLVDTHGDAAKAASVKPPPIPPGVYFNRVENSASEGGLVVLLLDALNTPWADQAYARQQMLKYLKTFHKGNQKMAIFGLTQSLLLLENFTDDPDVLRRAIEKKSGGTSPLLTDPDQGKTETPGITQEMSDNLDRFDEEQAAFQTDLRVRITLDALQQVGKFLAGYTGRKKLIWVSGGFPLNLDPGEQSGTDTQRIYGDEVAQTTALLTQSQVSVYPVDAQGLMGPPMFSAVGTGRTRAGNVMSGPQFGREASRRNSLVTSSHDTMRQLADGTGGVAFYNRNDLDTAIDNSVQDGAVYYALSYAPEDKNWDGKYRKIQVKVDRPGVQLRYRRGYFAIDPDAAGKQDRKKSEREMTAALGSQLLASGIAFYGSAQKWKPNPAQKQPDPQSLKAEVRFLVEPRYIQFQPIGEAQHCNIDFVVGAFQGSKMVAHSGKTFEGNLKPETYLGMMKNGILFRTLVDVPQQKVRLRLLVRDNLSGQLGTLDVPYDPAEASLSAPQSGAAVKK